MKLLRIVGPGFWGVGAASVVAGVLSGVASAGLVAVLNTGLHRPEVGRGLLAAVFVGLVVARVGGAALGRLLVTRFVLDAVVRIFRDLSRKVVATPLRQLERLGVAPILTTLTEDVTALAAAVQEAPAVAVNAAVVAGCAAYLGWLSWRVLVGVLIFVVAGVVVYRIAIGSAFRWLQRARETREHLFRHFQALTSGTKELQLHRGRREAFFRETIDSTTGDLRRASTAAVRVYVLAGTWTQLLLSGLLGGLLFLGPSVDGMTSETLVGYLLATLYLMAPVWAIIDSWPVFARARVALRKIDDLRLSLATEPEQSEDCTASEEWTRLDLDGVTFTYDAPEPADAFVLGPLDFTLRRGEVVFLVGGNGSGKSTFVKLLTGLYTPQVGAIHFDSVHVTDKNRSWYREHFAAVFSDFFLFDRLLGLDGNGVDARARDLLRRLEMDAKVDVRQGTFSTTALSQGQRKRLALLTAFLEDRPIYVFDEWAADQDPHYRDIFYRRLLPELKARGKTVVVISHDERYYHLGDRVVKLEYGRIAG